MLFNRRLYRVLLIILVGVLVVVLYNYWKYEKHKLDFDDIPLIKNPTIARSPETQSVKIKPIHFSLKKISTTTTPNPWIPKVQIDRFRKGPEILRWKRLLWEEWDDFCSDSPKFESVTLKTPAGELPIFIHNVTDDKLVSGSIKDVGSWEGDIMALIYYFLRREPELNLIDLGAHVGEFSLMAAKLGRQALAVDPLFENVQRLCKSIQKNNFSPQIKVFYSALSNVRTKVSFHRQRGNIGGTKIYELDVLARKHSVKKTQLKQSVVKVVHTPKKFDKEVIESNLLDDMLPLVSFKHAFMKIDVEEHEHLVLLGGEGFFNAVNVRYVFMEWFQHASNPNSAKQIIKFMNKHHYSAESPDKNHSPLDYNQFDKWPLHVLWVKK